MPSVHLEVPKEAQGQRIDHYLIKNLELAISRSSLQRLITTGKITVNQKPVKAHYKVKEHDALQIEIPEVAAPMVLAEPIPLDIIFEDDDLLIINKPSGMVTHPAAGNYAHTLVSALLNHTAQLSTINGPLRPGIVHRLDKDTSGLLVVAKNDSAHLKLAQQFQRHTVKRQYIAIVKGRLAHQEGVIDYPLARHPQDRKKIQVSFHHQARPALTRYKVLNRYTDMTLLELTPYTGRTHQLRVHLKFCGHPILGDKRYGQGTSFPRLALHAKILGLCHPRSQEYVEFQTELPQCFKDFLINHA